MCVQSSAVGVVLAISSQVASVQELWDTLLEKRGRSPPRAAARGRLAMRESIVRVEPIPRYHVHFLSNCCAVTRFVALVRRKTVLRSSFCCSAILVAGLFRPQGQQVPPGCGLRRRRRRR